MTLDFSAAFTKTTTVGTVTFKNPYPSPPIVILQQIDLLEDRQFVPVSVTETGYEFTCNAFSGAELHEVHAIVIHPSEAFD